MKKFVSRGGEKLQHVLDFWKIDVRDKICADLGSSTGGFVDCLLQNGAKKVYAVETGYGVLDWKLRNDPRVVVMERTNAIHVVLPELVDFISIDVSWTPQRLIIPHALELLKSEGNIVSLLKPHYEADKHLVRGGKIEEKFLPSIIEKVRSSLQESGTIIKDVIESPITGKKGGNKEYFLWIKKS